VPKRVRMLAGRLKWPVRGSFLMANQ
jgi:hypothetical protein